MEICILMGSLCKKGNMVALLQPCIKIMQKKGIIVK